MAYKADRRNVRPDEPQGLHTHHSQHHPSAITPNMVTLFTLGVSVTAGVFFARGGYWNTLLGGALSVWASILDGCDGEVARLKLQASDFGCWLETVCDYLYYVLIFGGMSIGLARTMGWNLALVWGTVLLFGAVASFLTVGFARHHFSPERPESFLAIWQKKAEKRSSNPFLYVGRIANLSFDGASSLTRF